MSEQSNAYLAHGIRLAQEGQKDRAAPYLARAVQINPRSESGWLWLAACLTDIDQQRYCLGRALQLNPRNLRARQALERLNRPTRVGIQQASHEEITQPVRTAAQVPVTGGAMVFEVPVRQQTGAGIAREYPEPARSAPPPPAPAYRPTQQPARQAAAGRLPRLTTAQIALLILGILLALVGLLYFLWTILAPGATPSDLLAVVLSRLPDRLLVALSEPSLLRAIWSQVSTAWIPCW